MSEIDKLINQAFPDELRDIEPIDVDEDAILAMTLEQLGLAQGPELPAPVAKPLRRLTEREPNKEKSAEPEFVEVPVVVHHRWVDWAGWAIAACLVLVCAVNWGPWLVNNLDFGIGPRSPGMEAASDNSSDTASGQSSGDSVIVEGGEPIRGGTVTVFLSTVEYNGDELTITLYIDDLVSYASPDLDKLMVKLTDGDKELEYVNRSNRDKQIVMTYKLGSRSTLTLTVEQLVELSDSNGEAVGWTPQVVEDLSMNLTYGYATSRFDNREFTFTKRPQ